MDNLFLALLLLSLLGLGIGLAKPQLVKMPSRKIAGWSFGGAAAVFFVLFGMTAPPTSSSAIAVVSPASTTPQVVDTATETPSTIVHAATQTQTVASAEQPVHVPAQQPSTKPTPTSVPSEPATLTDSAYMEQFEGNVMLYIQAVNSDVLDGNAAIADSNVEQTSTKQTSDISAALSDFQQGQSDLAQAQAALQALQSKMPSDMTNIQGLAGEYLSSEAQVLSLSIGHINSNTLSMSDTSDVYTQMNRSNLYQGQLNTAIQQWETNNI